MKRKVLLSFDVEEFDLPREHGATISLEDGVKVSAEGLVRILEMLDGAGVKATFFCTGNFAEARPDLVAKIREGWSGKGMRWGVTGWIILIPNQPTRVSQKKS